MLDIYLLASAASAASPDRGLAWLIYALLAFLLIIIVVGALVGASILDGRAPGALRETQSTEDPRDDRSAGHEAGA